MRGIAMRGKGFSLSGPAMGQLVGALGNNTFASAWKMRVSRLHVFEAAKQASIDALDQHSFRNQAHVILSKPTLEKRFVFSLAKKKTRRVRKQVLLMRATFPAYEDYSFYKRTCCCRIKTHTELGCRGVPRLASLVVLTARAEKVKT